MKDESESKVVGELKKLKGVKTIYLFGSHGTSRQLPFSDIDICVIGKLTKRERSEVSALSSGKIQISVFDELPIYIRFNVLKGRQLFSRDEKFLHDIKFSTVKEYLDFKPLLKRFERYYKVRI